MIDADLQGTISFGIQERDRSGIEPKIPIIKKQGQEIHKDIAVLAREVDLVVVDTGGRDSPESRATMLVADKLFLPMRPSQYDAWTLDRAEIIIADAMKINPKLKVFALINLANPNPAICEVDETKSFLKEFKNIRICKTVVHDRIAFRKSVSDGLSVVEWKPADPKASAEVLNLYKEIIRK